MYCPKMMSHFPGRKSEVRDEEEGLWQRVIASDEEQMFKSGQVYSESSREYENLSQKQILT